MVRFSFCTEQQSFVLLFPSPVQEVIDIASERPLAARLRHPLKTPKTLQAFEVKGSKYRGEPKPLCRGFPKERPPNIPVQYVCLTQYFCTIERKRGSVFNRQQKGPKSKIPQYVLSWGVFQHWAKTLCSAFLGAHSCCFGFSNGYLKNNYKNRKNKEKHLSKTRWILKNPSTFSTKCRQPNRSLCDKFVTATHA